MKKIFLLFSAVVFFSNAFSQTLAFRVTYPNVTISSVSQISDNGYIIAGHSTAYSIGSKDIVLIKTDSTGVVIWTKTFGNKVNANADDIAANAVEIPGGTGYYLAGQFWNQTNNTYEVYVLKTDANGNRLWSKTMYNGGYDKGMRVDNAAGGGCLVTGWLGNSSKGYLCHLDANGNIIWQNAVYYPAGAWILQSGWQTPDGGMVSCGYDNELGAYEMWLLKTNSAGVILWQRGYAMSATYNFSYDVCLTADSGFMLAGGSSEINLAKTDGSGNLQWAKTYSGVGATPRAYSVKQCQDTGYIVLANDISNNQYLMKTDSAGNVMWTMKYTGGYFLNTVEQTTDGGYVLAMGSDVIKTDANGVTGCGEVTFTLTASVLTLLTRTPAATNVSQAQNNVAADSSTSPVITITTCFPTGINVAADESNVIIFPNPATNELLVRGSEFGDKSKIEIYNVLGEKIFPSPLAPLSFRREDGGEVILNVSTLSSGIYFLQIRDKRGNEIARKFVKM